MPVVKNLPAYVGDAKDSGSIPELGRNPGVGNSNLLQYSCLENSTDREAWRATVLDHKEWDMTDYTLDCLLSRFSRVRLCATPWTAARQAPPSLGFSRQEHWIGLPFPSPMHESEKSK